MTGKAGEFSVAFIVSQHGGEAREVFNRTNVVYDGICPRLKGHLQKQKLRSLCAESVKAVAAADTVKVRHLGTQKYLRKSIVGFYAFKRLTATPQKGFERLPRRVKVRCCDHYGHALPCAFPEHGTGFLKASAAVVHIRQEVGVKVNHFLPPAE